jgi:hypothetical protein
VDESLPSYGYYDESNISGSAGPTGIGSGPSLLDYLNFAGRTSTGVLGALNQSKPTPKTAPTNWGLIGAIAVLGVLLLVMVVSGGKRG